MGFSSSFLLRLLLVVGFVCLLLFRSLGSGEGRRLKHGDEIGRDKPVNQAELDFNYMSKRRVPNGSDPVHNSNSTFLLPKSNVNKPRRAGNSGRPPGQA